MPQTPEHLTCAACRRPFAGPPDGDNPANECAVCWRLTRRGHGLAHLVGKRVQVVGTHPHAGGGAGREARGGG